MVQESFEVLKNTSINPLFHSIQNCPISAGSFFIPTLYQRCEPHGQKKLAYSINLIINHF